MFRKAAIVLAITLVPLSAARAEDPEQDFTEHLHMPGRHGETGTRHRVVRFSEPQRPISTN
jgi:hypothetical protein